MSVQSDDRRRQDSLDSLRREGAACRASPLWPNATQTVFGEGPPHAQDKRSGYASFVHDLRAVEQLADAAR